jgi:hypothetical protein
MNVIVNNEENFQTLDVYTVLMQGISTIFIDQMPTYLVFKKSILYAGIRIFNSLPCSVTILKNEKAKCKVSLIKYLNPRLFYSVVELCVKMIHNTVL